MAWNSLAFFDVIARTFLIDKSNWKLTHSLKFHSLEVIELESTSISPSL